MGWGQQSGRVRVKDRVGHSSVRRDRASTQAAARQALEDAHGYVHEGAEIEEQVVEGVDRQATSLVCIF